MPRQQQVDELQRLGLSDAQIAEMIGAEEPEGFQVWPANWPTVKAFLLCATQWRFFDGVCLDYAGAESAFRLAKVECTAEMFNGIRLMENAVRKHQNGK